MTREQIVAGAYEAIQNGSKSFRAASRLFDRTTRERAWLLYSWCRHCDDVCDGQTYGFGNGVRGNVSVLRGKTHRAVAGEAMTELPFQALSLLLSECPIPERFLDDHLRGFALDESGWQPGTEEDLALYCYYVAGAVGCMMAILMGVPADDEDTLERAADLGIAFQLSNIARDVREDLAAGRCYLPLDWMNEFGVTRETLFDERNEDALVAIVKRLVDSVAVYEESARLGVEKLPFRSRLAVLSALRIYGAIGRRVGRLGRAAWDQRVTVGKMQKLAYVVPSFAEAVVAGRS
ncbi:phytoene/squalene synthase family protein [Sphingomonas daechungensis]|uniref:phytoene/squalene synthase family protein n=1 Tax=Sphingomonas daechungensis TaxID=1176646 RepID=UPI003784168B